MIGQTVGAYKLTRKLGEGGMGAVYYGEHSTLGRAAAIKVLLPQYSMNKEVVNRFFNEARATGLIRHPGLVDVFDYGQLPSGCAFIVMELLEGESLSSRIKRDRIIAVDPLLSIGRQIAQAVGAAHGKHIVHRDLKPDNVYLVPDDEVAFGIRAKVLDFGIAKLTDTGENSGVQTNTSAVMGTPMYMSPEQCRGAGQVDHRSDIYSLGCILYEMACGRPPFIGAIGDLFIGHMRDDPTPPMERNPEVPHFLNDLILWMLRKSPEARPQSMAELVAAIDSQVSRPISGRFDHARQSSPRIELPRTPSYGTPLPPDSAPPSAGVHGQQTIAFDPTNPAAGLPSTPTTLSGAASEVRGGSRGGGRGSTIAVAAAFATVLLAGGGYVALRKNSTSAPTSPVATAPSTPIAAPPPAPAKIEPPPAAPAAPAAPAKIALRIDSTPPGAEVFRAADGLRLGTTPLDYRLDAAAGTLPLIVKLDGYSDERIELDVNRDGAAAVTLRRKATASSKAKPSPTTKSPSSGPRKVLVDDPFAN